MAKSAKKVTSRAKAPAKAPAPVKSAPKAAEIKKPGPNRILTAEGWKRLVFKDAKKGKKG